MAPTHVEIIEGLIDTLNHIAHGEFVESVPKFIRKKAANAMAKALKELDDDSYSGPTT